MWRRASRRCWKACPVIQSRLFHDARVSPFSSSSLHLTPSPPLNQSFQVLNLNSSNNIAGNVLICIAMLVFLVVPVVVPRDSGFQRFISWFVGVVLGLNLVNNIRLMSRVAKKKLLKSSQPAMSGKLKTKVTRDL